jgi:hypothetical protein
VSAPAPAEKVACPDCSAPDRPTLVQVNKDGTLRKHQNGPVPCTASGQPYGTARIPRRSSAGFYKCHVTGAMLRSVTTILSQGSPKEALIHWAGKLVAETAMEHLPQLVRASRNPQTAKEMTDWLKRAHTRKKEERADVGTTVHTLVEAEVLGTPVPDEIAANPEWQPYMANFRQFVTDWDITFEASEMVVANYTDGYAGTLDYQLRSPLLARALGAPEDALIGGDSKTGGELDERTYDGNVRGVYPTAGVQLAAYRRAEYGWLRDGTRVPLERAYEVGVVLHLRPEGYRLYPMRCGDDVYEVFQHIRRVAEFETGLAKSIVGQALKTPTRTTRKVA